MSTIEFANNGSGNWFAVAYDLETIQSIVNQAREFGLRATKPKFYEANSKAPARFLSYFNNQDTKELYKWCKQYFTIKNAERKAAGERTEEAVRLKNQHFCAKATISRYPLGEVKSAMISVIGTPAEIRDLFDCYNIKVVGVAGLPQCLQLIEELDKFDAVLNELRKPKEEVPVYTPEVITDPFDIPFEAEVDIDSPEFNAFVLAAVHQMALTLPPAQAPIDFEPWTSTELTAYTVKEIRKLAVLDGIDLTGTSKMKKSELIKYILPALNAAALAAHLA